MNEDFATRILNESILNAFELNDVVRKNEKLAQLIHDSIALAASTIMGGRETGKITFDKFGTLVWPNVSFGNVSSIDLFNLPEMALFHIYSKVAKNYEIALDLGANIGLHSVIMSKAGFKKIIAVEADPSHIPNLENNLLANEILNVEIKNKAVSNKSSKVVFSRVLGNLTGSHIRGSKENVYGEIDEIEVDTFPLKELLNTEGKIFCKMDIEGHELVAISGISESVWQGFDLVVEISSKENAAGIFEYCQRNNLYIFSEKNSWKVAKEISDVPINWREGSALITTNLEFLESIMSA